jgi:DNA-binding transcriptional LysR family regulator
VEAIDWTEIQTVICVAKNGSLSGAARDLAVNHSTILRRIQSFERKHHVNVFIREPQGYRLSRHGRALLQDFDQIDQVMLGLQRRITDYDTQLEGRLTITSTENIFASYLKTPIFEFAKIFPRVELDLLISNQVVDMSQLEADVAIRPMSDLPEHHFGFRLFELTFYFYAPKDMVDLVVVDKVSHFPSWIGYSGALANSRAGNTLSACMQTKPVLTANSFDGVSMAANEGLGIALLPSFIGESCSNLVQLDTEALFTTGVFVTAPKDLSVSRRVNALMNFLNVHFSEQDRIKKV